MCGPFSPVLLFTILTSSSLASAIPAQAEWRQVPAPDARENTVGVFDPRSGESVLLGGAADWTMNDMWRWNGQRWQKVDVVAGPSSRAGMRLVHDTARNTLLLFGGYIGSTDFNETWVFNGQRWGRIFPATSPGPRHAPGLAFDTARGVAVLQGGYSFGHYADTWEWDGGNWQLRASAGGPGGRNWQAMTYDPARQVTLLFGGHNGSAATQDTWTWNGTAWAQQSPTARPPARWNTAMVFDQSRGVAVLFGGSSGTASLGDTWEWDGTNWRQQTFASSPPSRSGHALTYDARRQRVVLTGGNRDANARALLNDVWEWDGTTWTQVVPTSPMGRWSHSMVHDSIRNEVALFGGNTQPNVNRRLNDTWTLRNGVWTARNLAVSPSAREATAMAFDPVHGETILFGGYTPTNVGDTWAWDGTTWSQRWPTSAPTARHGHKMAWHATQRQIFLFAGNDGSPRNDLWSYDGTTWTNRTPASGPIPSVRWHTSMAYDPLGDRLVVFGGQVSGGVIGDTWAWNDQVGWTQLSPPANLSPPARGYTAMAFDPTRGAVVLSGGSNLVTDLSDTWELRGTTWTKCTQFEEPPPRSSHTLIFDPTRQRLLMFSGYPRGGDLWEAYNPNPATWTSLGTGCAVAGTTPNLAPDGDSLPWRGETFRLIVSNLPTSGFVTAAVLIGAPPAINLPIRPACTLYANPLVNWPCVGAGVGRAAAAIPIPPFASWVGGSLLIQGAILHANPTLDFGLSQAGEARVGARHP